MTGRLKDCMNSCYGISSCRKRFLKISINPGNAFNRKKTVYHHHHRQHAYVRKGYSHWPAVNVLGAHVVRGPGVPVWHFR